MNWILVAEFISTNSFLLHVSTTDDLCTKVETFSTSLNSHYDYTNNIDRERKSLTLVGIESSRILCVAI